MGAHEGLCSHLEKQMLPMELVLKCLVHSCCDQSRLMVEFRRFSKHLEWSFCFSFQEAAMTSCASYRMSLHSTQVCFPQNVSFKRTIHYCFQFSAMTLYRPIFEAAYWSIPSRTDLRKDCGCCLKATFEPSKHSKLSSSSLCLNWQSLSHLHFCENVRLLVHLSKHFQILLTPLQITILDSNVTAAVAQLNFVSLSFPYFLASVLQGFYLVL